MGLLAAPPRPNPIGLGDLNDQTGHIPRVIITTSTGLNPTDTETYLDATITINGAQPYSGTTQIRGRGNTTWLEAKKPWRLKLTTAAALLGMPIERDWVLLANHLDTTKIRTAVAMEIGARCPGLAWTPRMRFVEVVLNGVFLGLYQLGEHVENGPQKVNVSKPSGNTGLALTGAYLLEIDQRLEQDGNHGFRTTLQNVPVTMDDPDDAVPEQKAYVQTWINTFESALYSSTWLDPATGYAQYIDRDSFIDWYLVNELCKNADSNFFSSCKLYKTRDTATVPGRLVMGPLWDFDRSLGNLALTDPTGWHTRAPGVDPYPGAKWIDRMLQDPAFFAALLARWTTLRTALTTGDSMGALIDRLTDRLTWATGRDQRTWSYTANTATLGDAMKTWLSTRIAWMHTRFTDTVAPTTPTALTSTPGSGRAGLSWTASTDAGGVVRYRVRRGGVIVGVTASTSFVETGLTNGTAYSYTVSALDIANNESAQTAAVSVTPVNDTTAPTVPTGLAATAGSGQVGLGWTASTDNVAVTGYKVRRGGALIATVAATTYNDTAVTNGTQYSYTVSAIDAAGNESAQTSAVTATPVASNTETFTGADGASWPTPWTVGNSGTVKLLGNSGRLSPATGAYGTALATRPSPNDADLLMRWQWQTASSERYLDFVVRDASASAGNPKWRVRFTGDNYTLGRDSANTSTKPGTYSVGVWRWTRIRYQGTTVQSRTWADGSTEPGTWDVSVTDAAGPASGAIVILVQNGGDGAAATVLVDDVTVTAL